jgi:small-conductance mechanosensitive channel
MDNGYQFTRSLQNGLDQLFSLLPQILGVIVLLIIGWAFASIARKITKKLLRKVQFERHVTDSPAGNMVTRVIEHPTDFVAKFVYWIILLLFIFFAISTLNIPALNLMINGIYRYLPNILAAIIIFLVASAISAGAASFAQRVLRGSPLAKIVSAVIPAITMSIAIFMILNQLHIARDIVNITYTALMGSIALGLALAFGLGGRDVARRILDQAYDSVQENSETIKNESRRASANTKQQIRRAKSR